jgi:AcrR family transcriptional regulator
MTIVKLPVNRQNVRMTVTAKAKGRHHHGALRRALLDAVAEIVLEDGPEAVTLRECARRAGVSHSAAAPHFGDKRGLLTAFATEAETRLAGAMQTMLDALPEGAGPEARMAATGRGYIAFARACPAHFRLMSRGDLIDQTDPAWRAEAERTFALLTEAMEAVSPNLDARARRARLTLAWAGVHGYCSLIAEGVGGDLWKPEERAAEVAEDLVALIVAACATPTAGDPQG